MNIMDSRLKRIPYWGCLFFLSLGGYHYYKHQQPTFPNFMDAETLARTSDTQIKQIHYKQYDLQGRLTHYLQAPYVSHFSKNDAYQIQSPHIILSEPHRQPWDIQAERAVALYKGKQITLSQHVRIHQPNAITAKEIWVTTESLTYLPNSKKAFTQDSVLMTQGANQVSSRGIIADIDKQTIQLLADARGQYVQKP